MITIYNRQKNCSLPQNVYRQKSAQEDKSEKPVEEVKNKIFKLDKTINAIKT